ncbi:MAG: carboxypeptidase regulatory-like domain-containing protein, partial [Thermoplasmata archaeon]|nr:carboxypeptidase regulatory-like domain-containing protein [Thermoplasmata archaeon]
MKKKIQIWTVASLLIATVFVSLLATPGMGENIVSGQVLDGETGLAVEGADVVFWPMEMYMEAYNEPGTYDEPEPMPMPVETVTGPDGRFEVVLEPGDHSISVYAPGYEEYWGIYDATGEVVIRLMPIPEPNSILEGVITDEITGDGIYNASVFVYSSDPYWGMCHPMEDGQMIDCYYGGVAFDAQEVFTDENGAYSMALRPGFYTITVLVDGYKGYEGQFMIGEEQTFVLDIALEPLPPLDSTLSGVI